MLRPPRPLVAPPPRRLRRRLGLGAQLLLGAPRQHALPLRNFLGLALLLARARALDLLELELLGERARAGRDGRRLDGEPIVHGEATVGEPGQT